MNCLELITEYLTNSAYAYIATTGDNFFEGAYNALMIQIAHMGEFTSVLFLTKVVIFLGKVGCVALNVFLLDAVFKPMMITGTTSMIGPSIVTGVISWVISSIFMGMYEVSADTMVTCNAIDTEKNNGEPQKGPKTFAEDGKFHEVRKAGQELKRRQSGMGENYMDQERDQSVKEGLMGTGSQAQRNRLN